MEFPTDLKYAESDEWIRVEGNRGTIGISDYAQEQLSDIVYVEVLAAVGVTLAKGEAYAAVESVKAAADIYLPVGGKIVEINEALADEPEKINADPYGEAWIARIEISDPSELDALMDAAAYEKHCEGREH
jgi:glycine cleavage system H protein